MTEKERREQGLPPSPSSLALTDTIRKDGEEMMEYMAKMMRPVLVDITGPTSSIAESIRRMSGPMNDAGSVIAKMAEAHQSTLSEFARVYEHKEDRIGIPAITFRNEPRTVRLAPDQFDELVKKMAAPEKQNTLYMDLMYSRSTKEMYRDVYNQRFTSTFKDSEGNKRLLLVEKLIDSGKPVATKKLAEYLNYTQKAVQNLVQAINAKIESDMHLPQSLIKANRGSGYYINKFFCIYPTE
jgi:hypothetical protein